MGELVILNDRVAARRRAVREAPVAFFFDVCCPFSYLAAERVERLLGNAHWIPVAAVALHRGEVWTDVSSARANADRRAATLRVPLVWPDRFPTDAPGALRAAAHAAEIGAGCRFALAACRLAFCGGFDLEDPEILAEAAAAAGIQLDRCLAAAGDEGRDGLLHARARWLLARGVDRLPAIRIGRHWFDGERGLAEAAAVVRAPISEPRPLAPVG